MTALAYRLEETRLLDPERRRLSLAEHRDVYPPPGLPKRRPDLRLVQLVADAGLRGRGGAGFPTARKLAGVAAGRGPRVVVANGTEGEPASRKDKCLLTRAPHLVLDGALLAARAVGAERVVLAVERGRREVFESVQAALRERHVEGERGLIELVEAPPRYVAGEETALVHWVNAGPAKPTSTPPRPYERGVNQRPTLVQNVETLAHLALIIARGPEFYRSVGEAEEPGTMLVTVSAAGRPKHVLETAIGTPIVDVLHRTGLAPDHLRALLVGGFFGTWIDRDNFDLRLSRSAMAAHGASPGAGVLIALGEASCGLRETARVLQWYAAESAGQCGPCVFGLADVARSSIELAEGGLSPEGLARLSRWGGEILGRGACHHPNGAVGLLRSALNVFAGDVTRHLAGDACPAAPVLATPRPATEWR